MGSRKFFANMIENGQFNITEDGHAILFGEFVVLTPGGVFLRLVENLSSELGTKKAYEVVQDLGEFQMKAAIRRYKRRFNIQNAESAKIMSFLMDILNILGWGSGSLSIDPKKKTARIIMKNSMLPQKYRATYRKLSKEPIDYFVLGWLKAMFEAYFGAEVEARETMCMAKGDPCCRFIIRAVVRKKSRKK